MHCAWRRIGGDIAREKIGGELGTWLGFARIAEAHECRDAGQLSEPPPIVFDALEKMVVDEDHRWAMRIQLGCDRKGADALDFDRIAVA